jgi:hypothetical protein
MMHCSDGDERERGASQDSLKIKWPDATGSFVTVISFPVAFQFPRLGRMTTRCRMNHEFRMQGAPSTTSPYLTDLGSPTSSRD